MAEYWAQGILAKANPYTVRRPPIKKISPAERGSVGGIEEFTVPPHLMISDT